MKRNLLLFLFFAYAVCPPAAPPAHRDDVLVFVVELSPRCSP